MNKPSVNGDDFIIKVTTLTSLSISACFLINTGKSTPGIGVNYAPMFITKVKAQFPDLQSSSLSYRVLDNTTFDNINIAREICLKFDQDYNFKNKNLPSPSDYLVKNLKDFQKADQDYQALFV